MRFDLITLFPELFDAHLKHGITRRAFDSGAVQVTLWPLRDFADDAYRRVDDRPYGGGPGMVMLAEPLQRALDAVRAQRADGDVPVVHFSPAGRRLDQALVREFAAGRGAIMLCGRYEGVDQRFIDVHVTHEISLGDFVLSGGELAALALVDAVARLMPGVLSEPSHQQDSFSDGLLEGPQYSRPESWPGPHGPLPVPPVLLSGHHAEVARWRRERSLALTAQRRPDLIAAARAAGRLDAADERYLKSLGL
ncbi:MAG TPA: tRNA (guanosine(37)-N1)-methyltransferase TrmD [Rubrivivax sp.]|nr:tRNA (guanosine(37)-N1)-methyltransferase TrmD [Rubrivivax sp.]